MSRKHVFICFDHFFLFFEARELHPEYIEEDGVSDQSCEKHFPRSKEVILPRKIKSLHCWYLFIRVPFCLHSNITRDTHLHRFRAGYPYSHGCFIVHLKRKHVFSINVSLIIFDAANAKPYRHPLQR